MRLDRLAYRCGPRPSAAISLQVGIFQGQRLCESVNTPSLPVLAIADGPSKLNVYSGWPSMPDDIKIDPFNRSNRAFPAWSRARRRPSCRLRRPRSIRSGARRKGPAKPDALGGADGTRRVACAVRRIFLLDANSPAKGGGERPGRSCGSRGAADGEGKPARICPPGQERSPPTEELSQAWSSKRFLFRDSVTAQTGPGHGRASAGRRILGILAARAFWRLRAGIGDRSEDAEEPPITSRPTIPWWPIPCNRTVYDLLRYGGGAGDNGLVRGEIVQGTGIRPPMAIEIQVKGKDVIATRME